MKYLLKQDHDVCGKIWPAGTEGTSPVNGWLTVGIVDGMRHSIAEEFFDKVTDNSPAPAAAYTVLPDLAILSAAINHKKNDDGTVTLTVQIVIK